MKKSLTIVKIEPKKSKKGDTYWMATSFQGDTYSVWDGLVAENMMKKLNVECEFEVEEKNGFKNIRELFDDGIDRTPIKIPAIEVREKAKEVETPKVTEIVNKTFRPNSRTFGKGEDQVKLYFEDADDLHKQILALNVRGLFPKNVDISEMLK